MGKISWAFSIISGFMELIVFVVGGNGLYYHLTGRGPNEKIFTINEYIGILIAIHSVGLILGIIGFYFGIKVKKISPSVKTGKIG